MIVLAPAHFVFRPGSLQAEAEQRRRRNVEPEDLGAAGGRERWLVAVSAKKIYVPRFFGHGIFSKVRVN
jgi:hypothetical protein